MMGNRRQSHIGKGLLILLVIVSLAAGLWLVLRSSRKTQDPLASLPAWIREAIVDEALLRVSWYRVPSEANFHGLAVFFDNHVGYAWIKVPDWYPITSVEGHLDEQAMEQIRVILRSLKAQPLENMGQERITISFMWEGENRIMSFDNSACQGELEPLLTLLASAFQPDETPPFPCQEGQTASEAPDTTVYELPYEQEQYHLSTHLCLDWFHVPSKRHESICIFSDQRAQYVIQEPDSDEVRFWNAWLEDEETQRIRQILIRAEKKLPLRRPVGDTAIVLALQWNLEYPRVVTGEDNCTQEMATLFELLDAPFERRFAADILESPCLSAD